MKSKDQILLEQSYQKVLKENFPTPTTVDLHNISVYDFIQSLENGKALERNSSEHSILLSVMGAIQKAKSSHPQSSKADAASKKAEMDAVAKENQAKSQERWKKWMAGDESAGQLPHLKSKKRMVEFLPERPGDKPIYQK